MNTTKDTMNDDIPTMRAYSQHPGMAKFAAELASDYGFKDELIDADLAILRGNDDKLLAVCLRQPLLPADTDDLQF